MGIRLKRLRALLKPAILLFLLFISCVLLGEALLKKPAFQSYIIEKISHATGYELTVKRMSMNLWHGLGVSLSGVKVEPPDGAFSLSAVNARVIFDLKRLLKRDIVPVALYLDRPLLVVKGGAAQPSIDIRKSVKRTLGLLGSIFGIKVRFISIDNGRWLSNRSRWYGQDIYMNLRSQGADIKRIIGSGTFSGPYGPLSFSIKGKISQIKGETPYPLVTGSIKFMRIPLTVIPEAGFIKIKRGSISRGVVDIASRPGKELFIKLKGELDLKDIDFSFKKNRNESERVFPSMKLSFLSRITEHEFTFPSFTIGLPDTRLSGKGLFDIRDLNNPEINIMLNTPWMDIHTFKNLFPGPIVSSWLESGLFPLLRDGYVKVDNFSLSGRLSKIKRLDRPQNRDVLNISISFRDMVFQSQDQRIPFEGISGKFSISDGDLVIKGISSTFGDSFIRDGRLKITSVFTDNRIYEGGIEGDFHLGELFSLKGVSWIPRTITDPLSVLSGVTGNTKTEVEFSYRKGKKGFRFKKINLQIDNALVSLRSIKNKLIIKQGMVTIDEHKKERRFEGDISIDKNDMRISGRFIESGSFYTIGLLKVSGKIIPSHLFSLFTTSEDLKIISTLQWDVNAELIKQSDSWLISGSFNPSPYAILYKGVTLYFPWDKSQLEFNLAYKNKKELKIDRLIYKINHSELAISGRIPIEVDSSEISMGFKSPGFNIDGLRVLYNKRDLVLKGILKTDIKLIFRSKDNLLINGPLRGRRLSISFKNAGSLWSSPGFMVEFSGRKLIIHSLNLLFNGSDIRVKGVLRNWARPRGNFELISNQFIIKENGSGSGFSGGALEFLKHKAIEIHAKISIKKGKIRGFSFAPLKADLVLKNGRIYLTHCEFRSSHAEMRLSGNFKEKPIPETIFHTYIKMVDQPAEEIFRAFGKKEAPLFGKLDFEAYFYSKGEDWQGMLSNLTGSANILIKDGRIKKSNMFIKILEILSINKVFERVPADMEKKGFYFKSMGCSGIIDKGVFSTDNFLLKSPIFNGAGAGSIDLTSNQLDGSIGIAPFKTVDSIVSHIPLLGHILTGKNKAFITYYFQIHGSITEPEVKYVPFKNLGKGTIRMIKKLLLAPVWIFKKIPKPSSDSKKAKSPNDIVNEED